MIQMTKIELQSISYKVIIIEQINNRNYLNNILFKLKVLFNLYDFIEKLENFRKFLKFSLNCTNLKQNMILLEKTFSIF